MQISSAVVAHPDGPPARDGESFGTSQVALPLNLLYTIISYLDDLADLARACRTCRMLHYMCLPVLYKRVVLRSYDHIRISSVTSRPEGMGGGSPFSMGLNALITRSVVGYVRSFEVIGDWHDYGLEENARAGRIPDGAMMLGLLVRAAIDRMPSLKEFQWTLNSKMLPTVWQGLANKETLETLIVRFPGSRLPSPSMIVPPIPSLRFLKITDIDPLCYPDNISDMLLNSRNLLHLRLHFSPRMRLEREPSLNLNSFFGRVRTSDFRMTLKTFSMQNLYAHNEGSFADLYDPDMMEEFTLIDSAGGANDDAALSFIAAPPMHLPRMSSLQQLRGNKVSHRHALTASKLCSNLRRYYLISGRILKDRPLNNAPPDQNGNAGSLTTSPQSVVSNGHLLVGGGTSTNRDVTASTDATPSSIPDPSDSGVYLTGYHRPSYTGSSIHVSTETPGNDGPIVALATSYLDLFCVNYSTSLTQILMLPQWRLSADQLSRVVRCCPLLEQLGCALDHTAAVAAAGDAATASADAHRAAYFRPVRAALAGLRKLRVLRVLDWSGGSSAVTDSALEAEDLLERVIGAEAYDRGNYGGVYDGDKQPVLRGDAKGRIVRSSAAPLPAKQGDKVLKWVGVGDLVFEVQKGPSAEVDVGGGEMRRARVVKRVPLAKVGHINMWKNDRLEI